LIGFTLASIKQNEQGSAYFWKLNEAVEVKALEDIEAYRLVIMVSSNREVVELKIKTVS